MTAAAKPRRTAKIDPVGDAVRSQYKVSDYWFSEAGKWKVRAEKAEALLVEWMETPLLDNTASNRSFKRRIRAALREKP